MSMRHPLGSAAIAAGFRSLLLVAACLTPALANAASVSVQIGAEGRVGGVGGPDVVDSYFPAAAVAAQGPLSESYFASAVAFNNSSPTGVLDEVRLDITQTSGSGIIGQTLEIEVPFLFGEAVEIDANLMVVAVAESFADPRVQEAVITTSVTDFWNTARWAGISAVRDASGNPLASWSVRLASGTDYARALPAPEREVPALLAAAVLGFAW
jgi:hypothetical protein